MTGSRTNETFNTCFGILCIGLAWHEREIKMYEYVCKIGLRTVNEWTNWNSYKLSCDLNPKDKERSRKLKIMFDKPNTMNKCSGRKARRCCKKKNRILHVILYTLHNVLFCVHSFSDSCILHLIPPSSRNDMECFWSQVLLTMDVNHRTRTFVYLPHYTYTLT